MNIMSMNADEEMGTSTNLLENNLWSRRTLRNTPFVLV